MKLHPMAIARAIVVETNPGPGGVKLGVHSNSVAATVADRQIRAQGQNVIDRKRAGAVQDGAPSAGFCTG
jgi:hypothetical protein